MSSITEYTFVNTTAGADNLAELYDYLTENAGDYFDSITKDGSTGYITCSVNGGGSILFDSTKITMTLAGGVSRTGTGNLPVTKAYKTSNGIMLISTGSQLHFPCVITKSNEDNTFVIFNDLSATAGHFAWADLVKSSTILNDVLPAYGYSNSLTAPMTALVPIVASGGVYSPNLFLEFFTEYPNINTVLSMGGTEYVSSGRLALAD